MEQWSNGAMEYWSIGVLEYWGIGVLEYWSIGVLEYWSRLLFLGPMTNSRAEAAALPGRSLAHEPQSPLWPLCDAFPLRLNLAPRPLLSPVDGRLHGITLRNKSFAESNR
jgi:hypothetical protein